MTLSMTFEGYFRYYKQGDHSPDNMKFPDGSRHSCPC